MKYFVILFALVVVAAALPSPAETSISVSDDEWAEFKKKHDKKYDDPAEDERRRRMYLETKKTVEEHNKKFDAGEVTYSIGINHFADLTAEERHKYTHGVVRPGSSQTKN